jgi:hypothetical protein
MRWRRRYRLGSLRRATHERADQYAARDHEHGERGGADHGRAVASAAPDPCPHPVHGVGPRLRRARWVESS